MSRHSATGVNGAAAAGSSAGLYRRSTLAIRTPEGIVFTVETAAPISRFLALVVDQACIYTAASVLTAACGALGFVSADIAGAVWMVSWFCLSLGYPIALEWLFRGQTIGKRILRLRVMDVQALRLTFSQVVVRNLLRFVDALPALYLVGGAATLLSSRAQRLGDLAANTVVVHHPRVAEPDLARLAPDKFNSFRDHPHLAARLAQNLTEREASVLVQSLLRRDELDDVARIELFEELRRGLEARVPFPPEVSEGISAEQYVRNVVDILVREETR